MLIFVISFQSGQKVGIILEELGVDYDAHVINIGKGEQFTSGFVEINPNSKIPALVDKEGPDGKSINLFESASIALYLAEKYNKFIPADPRLRAEMFNWIFWQMGGLGPFPGQFGHFFVYAPGDKIETRDYGVARYGMETQRLCSVLDQYLATRTYLVGEEYSLADMIVFPWFNQLRVGYKHTSGVAANDFLSIENYKNANAWADRILERPAVQRGLKVCHWSEGAKPWLNQKPEEAK